MDVGKFATVLLIHKHTPSIIATKMAMKKRKRDRAVKDLQFLRSIQRHDVAYEIVPVLVERFGPASPVAQERLLGMVIIKAQISRLPRASARTHPPWRFCVYCTKSRVRLLSLHKIQECQGMGSQT